MSRQIVHPEELDFQARGRRDYWVALEHDSIWGEYLIPLTVWVGPEARPGQGLVATGSTHGNEYEGPVALKNLLEQIDTAAVRGRIIFIPVLNAAAFRTGTRDSVGDDGVNLNRAFVDGAGEHRALAGITHRIVRFVREYVWPQVHVVLDLHAGGVVARFALCTSFHPLDDANLTRRIEETARWFGTPLVIVYQNRTPGLMVSEAERLGKITVGGEFGWGEAVNHEGVRYAMHGVRAAAIQHGQLTGTIEPIGHHAAGTQHKAEMVDYACFVAAPFAGHYEEVVPCGSRVRKGDVVGRLHAFDRIDEPGWPVRAGVDGFVIAQAWGARVNQGQHILVVGQALD